MRTGKYVNQLQGDFQYKAFIPGKLPFTLHSDSALEKLLSKADFSLGKLEGTMEYIPDVDFFLLMYVRKESTLSSQIEGTKATFSDVLKAEAKIADTEIHNDVDEILNYINAMNHGLKRMGDLPLSLRLIKEIHGLLLKGVRGRMRSPGKFRVTQNWIGGPTLQTASYIPPPPHEVLPLMGNLEKYLHNNSPVPVLIRTGLIHAQFERIHPFLDGNGRIGRLLITLYLCQQGILTKPLLYLSEFFKQYRQDYYDKLEAIERKDDIEGWLKFFLTGVQITADKAVNTARKIHELRENSVRKVMHFGRTSGHGMTLLNSLNRTPLLRISDVERITGLKNPNAIVLVAKFVKAGILSEITGKKRNRIFSYKAYIDLFE